MPQWDCSLVFDALLDRLAVRGLLVSLTEVAKWIAPWNEHSHVPLLGYVVSFNA